MKAFLGFTVVGIVDGCIYALTATGLVVTYITSGIFNFAHGAIGMLAAFTYWDLTVHYHWPVPIAFIVVVFVLAPLLGALIETRVMRKLHAQSIEVTMMVTVGLLLFFIGIAQTRWNPGQTRILPQFFAGHSVVVFGVNVPYHEVIVVLAAGAVAIGLRLFLFRTRPGTALRAVVDAPDLAALNGARPPRVSQLGWAIGSSLAALAGVLLAPLVTLDILTLTLLVINGYAAAIVGKLTNLPLTFVGGLALGLGEAYAIEYIPGSLLSQLKPTLPIIFLYIALLVIPQKRLRVGRALSARTARAPGLRVSLAGAAAFTVCAIVLVQFLSITNLFTFGKGIAAGMVVLSLVLLTGYGGQISLCQWTFAGFGAFAMGNVGHGSILGVIAALAVAGAVGALAALPAMRLQGLYLALITLAFGDAMTFVFFNNNNVFGNGGALKVPRIWFHGDKSFVILSVVVLAACGVGVLALRRSEFGRRLAAMSDSQLASTTLGMSLTWTKVAVFSLSAALAGLGGVFYGGLNGSVGSNDFVYLNSLAALLLLAIWGVDSVAAAFAAGVSFTLIGSVLQSHFPHIPSLLYLLTGLGALGIGRNPRGVIRQVVDSWHLIRELPAKLRPPVEEPLRPVPRPVAHTNGDTPVAPALELIGIKAAYGRIEVVHGVDLVVPPASVLALLGPNGAGKSTILKVISGLMAPTEGCIHMSGVHVNGASPESLARLGVCTIPEGRGVFANLTVAENLRMMSYREGARTADIEERAYTRFPRLAERRSQLAGTLSGGEQQMLSIARAVSTEPSLLLLDEISMGLAPLIVNELYDVVLQLASEGVAILVVEQFVRTAMGVADYVAVMSHGQIETMGQAADVTGAVSSAYMGKVG